MKPRPSTVRLAKVRTIPFWFGKGTVAFSSTGFPTLLGSASIVIGRVTTGKSLV